MRTPNKLYLLLTKQLPPSYFAVISLSSLLLIGLLILFAASIVPNAQFIHVGVADNRTFANGFWPPENRDVLPFRWTNGDSQVLLPSWEKASSLAVSLKLSGPQWQGAQPADLNVETRGHAHLSFQVAGSWRWYHILLPHSEMGWKVPEFQLRGNTQTPSIGDRRTLGVALSRMDVRPTTQLSDRAVVTQVLYFGAFITVLCISLWRIIPLWQSLLVSLILTSCLTVYSLTAPLTAASLLAVNWHWIAILSVVATTIQLTRAYSAASSTSLAWIVAGFILVIAGHLVTLTPPGALLGCGLMLTGALIITHACHWTVYLNTQDQLSPIPDKPIVQLTYILVSVGVTALLSLLFLTNLETRAHYHGDEAYWISIGLKAFQTAFVEHDLYSTFWKEPYETFGSFNPQVGKYLIGASVYLAGYQNVEAPAYNFFNTLDWNIAHDNLLPASIMAAGRLPVAVAGVVCCLLLFWLTVQSTSIRHGILVLILLLTGRPLVELSRMALVDVPALAFSLLSINLLVLTLKSIQSHDRSAVWLSAMAGISCGLAIGTKMNATLIYLTIAIAFALAPIAWAVRMRGLIVMTVWTWVTVFISNPFLYTQPIAGIRHMLSLGTLVGTINSGQQLLTFPDRIRAIWDSMSIYSPLAQIGLPGDRLLLLCGIAVLLSHICRTTPITGHQFQHILLVWLALEYIGITLWLPQDWNRYYLPLQPINVMIEAYGIIWLLQGIATHVQQWKKRTYHHT